MLYRYSRSSKNYFSVCFCRSAEQEMLQPVDLNLINDLWVPNVFIYNLKTFKVKGKNRFCKMLQKLKVLGSKIM